MICGKSDRNRERTGMKRRFFSRGFFWILLSAWAAAALTAAGCTAQGAGAEAPGNTPAVQNSSPAVTTAIPTAAAAVQATVETASTAAATRVQSSAAPSQQPTAIVRPTLGPNEWMNLPVIPVVSERAREIYRRGQELGNNPHAFAKVGDCESTGWFLIDFDNGPRYYKLGPYEDALQPVIGQFPGSFKRLSVSVRPGFTATSVLTPLWADPKQCNAKETPLACEYRLTRPSFVFITLGSNNAPHFETFEPQMRRILDYTIEQGVEPILATKADNIEKDHRINAVIAKLAVEYDVPLWNFWRAVQDLPDQGLQDDGAHLTWGPNLFNDPLNMKRAWPVRNLTALQALDAVWKGVQE
jgi:hypothetical protein